MHLVSGASPVAQLVHVSRQVSLMALKLVQAITEGIGPLGRVITAVQSYEDPQLATASEIPLPQLAHPYLAATGWSTRTLEGVLGRRTATVPG